MGNSSVDSPLLEDLHMSSGYREFEQCYLIIAIAENDDATILDSSWNVTFRLELGLISSIVFDEGYKLAKIILLSFYVWHFGAIVPSKNNEVIVMYGYHSWVTSWPYIIRRLYQLPIRV